MKTSIKLCTFGLGGSKALDALVGLQWASGRTQRIHRESHLAATETAKNAQPNQNLEYLIQVLIGFFVLICSWQLWFIVFFKSWKVPVLDDPHEGFLKWGYPQIIHFKRMFHYKPSIWGYPHFGKPPHDLPLTLLDNFPQRISWLRTALHMACSWPEGLQALLEARRMLKGCWWVETKSDFLKWGTPKSSQICHAYQDFLDSFGISIILYCISQFCESQKWLPQREDQFWS